MNCPCKDCDRRKLGCHGFCEGYQAWKKWNDEKNEKRREEKEKDKCHSKAFETQINRMLRRKR